MASQAKQKQKLLLMKKLFETRTDEEHALTGNQLIDILSQHNIKCERKTIYDDVDTLISSGMEIETTKIGHSNAYYLANRLFQEEELFVLVDAVASSRFLTIKKSNELIDKLQTLASDYKAGQLKRSVYVKNRSKSFNETIYYAINSINNGIVNDFDIEFKYYEYNLEKKRQLRHGGETYRVSPFYLVCNDNNYYLICYNHKREKVSYFRVDRMKDVVVTNIKRHKLTDAEDTQARQQRYAVFDMWVGEKETVTIQFEKHLVDAVIDKFTDRVAMDQLSDNAFTITVDVQISPAFWGWLFQFGSSAKIIAPSSCVDLAKAEISKLSDIYK